MKRDYKEKLDWARESVKREIRRGVEAATVEAKKWVDEAESLSFK